MNAGHVSPRIWEVEIFYYLGGGVRGIFASRKYEHVAIQVSYKGQRQVDLLFFSNSNAGRR